MINKLLEITLTDMVQIFALYLAIYLMVRYIKGTRGAQILLGVCVVLGPLLLLPRLFGLAVLEKVIYTLTGYLALALVVVFQQDIRRFLALFGGVRFFFRSNGSSQEQVPEKLSRCVTHLSRSNIGALIAIERGISLLGYEESGVRLNALLSHELLVSIFTPPLPLHDGGIILRRGRIAAAHCLFPISNKSTLMSSGMRHRAAVGLSEETDAVVLVVSEETGQVSIAFNGRLHQYGVGAKAEKVVLRWLRVAMPDNRVRSLSFSDWVVSTIIKPFRRYRKLRGGIRVK